MTKEEYNDYIKAQQELKIEDVKSSKCKMYNKFIIFNDNCVLRISDIETFTFESVVRTDTSVHGNVRYKTTTESYYSVLHTKSGENYKLDNVYFYNEDGSTFTINTKFEDEWLAKDGLARVNAQFLIRLVSLEE